MIEAFTNKVFDMDAIEFMQTLPDDSIDMGLFDLPYGVTAAKWDTIIPLESMWEQLRRIAKPKAALVFTATQPFSSRLVSSNYEMFKYEWVWINKSSSTGFIHAKNRPLTTHENILIFSHGVINHENLTEKRMNYYPQKTKGRIERRAKRHPNEKFGGIVGHRPSHKPYYYVSTERYPIDSLEISDGNSKTIHPTQKPVALFEYLIKTYTRSGEIVLDITCGSGTTGIACTNLDRQYILNDNGVSGKTGERWSDIARNRIQAHDPTQNTVLSNGSKQLSLFSEATP